jgi:HAD superfamily hydrolase (TIGR01509 family)
MEQTISDRAVLWDLDGTLVDSGDYHWRSWRDTMAAEGLTITYREFLDSFGQKNDRILAGWLGTHAAVDRVRRISEAKEEEYRCLAREEGLAALPGAAEWVARLRADGWRQAIASSAPRANVDVMLAALGLSACFDSIVSAEDVASGKPNPEVFLKAAQKLSVSPSACIVVEDAAAGIEAARRAGMRSIGVSRTTVLDADVFVRSLVDLPADAFSALVSRSNRG